MDDELLDLEQIAQRYQRKLSWVRGRQCKDPHFPKASGKRLRDKKKSRPVAVFRKSQVEQYLAWWDSAEKDKLGRVLTQGQKISQANKQARPVMPVFIGTDEYFNQQALRFLSGNYQLTLKPRVRSKFSNKRYEQEDSHAA